MDIDTLKEKWAEYDRKLDASIRLNRELLLAVNRDRIRTPLRRFAFFEGLGALIGIFVLMILGQFIYQHWPEPRFAVPALTLDIWLIANVAAAIRQNAMANRIDYDKPIAAIQRELESLRIFRIRVTQWALPTGVALWTPFVIVALQGFWGVDAYKVAGVPYLLVNLGITLALIPLGIWMAKKIGRRFGQTPQMQRLIRDLAGHNLNEATDFLAKLSEFESGEV